MDENATFCPACGKPVAVAVGGAGAAAAPGVAPTASGSSTGLEPNLAGLLCYLPIGPIGLIISIVFLVVEPYKNNRFVRFHAFQSIFLAVACIGISIGLMIIGAILSAISLAFAALMIPVWGIYWLGVLVLVVVAMIKAVQNQMWKIPFIGDFAEKQANAA